jgi:hypothetical protein
VVTCQLRHTTGCVRLLLLRSLAVGGDQRVGLRRMARPSAAGMCHLRGIHQGCARNSAGLTEICLRVCGSAQLSDGAGRFGLRKASFATGELPRCDACIGHASCPLLATSHYLWRACVTCKHPAHTASVHTLRHQHRAVTAEPTPLSSRKIFPVPY